MKVVIVGNGIAANEVAFSIRKKNRDVEIKILSAEKFPEYDPCSLPYFVSQDLQREAVFRKSLEDYQDHNIELVLDAKIVSIDADEKKVVTEHGQEHPYDRLVLAHGGDLFVPPIAGIDKHGVLSCKLLCEADRLAAHKGRAAVVIGSGAIGIEAAEALKKTGYDVSIIELLDWVMPVLFDEVTAGKLTAALENYGIHVFTGEKVLKILGETGVCGVETDQRTIQCDTVVLATGVVPNIALAKTAGIRVDRGIRVNRHMQTNVPGIYACGDCVETVDACTGEDAMFQLKHNATDQAQVVAKHILGEDAGYVGAYAFARAHFFDTHAVTFGKTSQSTACLLGDTEIIEREDGDSYLRLILMDGKVVGGQAIGKFADSIGFFMGAMWRKDDLNAIREDWTKIIQAGSVFPWTYRKIGYLIGLSQLSE